LIFFIVFVYQAQEWRMQARLYPWAIGIPMLILALVQVVLDLKGYKPKETADGTPLDFQFTQAIEPEVARKRAITMFAWLLGFFLLVWLLGFEYGIPLMVFGYLKIQSNESWKLSIILTILAFAFFWVLFVKLLTLPFPEGLLFSWLGA
jgi:putative tricarboxylic transport membrane protein